MSFSSNIVTISGKRVLATLFFESKHMKSSPSCRGEISLSNSVFQCDIEVKMNL